MVDIRILKTIVIVAALALTLALAPVTPAAAGFAEGSDAFRRGDYTGAAAAWRPLAEQDDVSAQHSLGYLYERSWGFDKDPSQAVDWYRAAAGRGNPNSMINVGALYAKGEGVERDLARAYT